MVENPNFAQDRWSKREEIYQPNGYYERLTEAKSTVETLVSTGLPAEQAAGIFSGEIENLRQAVDRQIAKVTTENPSDLASLDQLENFRNYLKVQEVLLRHKLKLPVSIEENAGAMNAILADIPDKANTQPEDTAANEVPEAKPQNVPTRPTREPVQLAKDAEIKEREPSFDEWSKSLETRYAWARKLTEIQGTYKAQIADAEQKITATSDPTEISQIYESVHQLKADAVSVWRIVEALQGAYETFLPSSDEIEIAADYKIKAKFLKDKIFVQVDTLMKDLDKELARVWGLSFEKINKPKDDLLLLQNEVNARIQRAISTNNVQEAVDLWTDKEHVLSQFADIFETAMQEIIDEGPLRSLMEQKIGSYKKIAIDLREKILSTIFEIWERNNSKIKPLIDIEGLIKTDVRVTRDIQALKNVMAQLNFAISEAQIQIEIPPHVNKDLYDAQIKNWLSQAYVKIEEIDKRIDSLEKEINNGRVNFGEKITRIETQLDELVKSPGLIKDIRNKGALIEKALNTLRTEFDKAPPETQLALKNDIENLERKAWKTEYGRIRHELLRQLNDLEAREPGGHDLGEQTRNYDELYKFRMDELAGRIKEEKYTTDAQRCDREKAARLSLFYHWKFFWGMTSSSRRVPKVEEMKANETMPLSSSDLDWFINEGLHKDPEWDEGDFTNEILPERTRFWKSRTQQDAKEEVKYNPSQFADVMRFIDDVYLGKKTLKTETGLAISVLALNQYIPDQFVELIAKETGIKKDIVRRAFRTHWCTTLHQSYLVADSNPQTADDYFYMFRWPRYLAKYRITGVDSSNLAATFLVWGMEGTNFFDDEVQKEIRSLLGRKTVKANLTDEVGAAHETTKSLLTHDDERMAIKGFGSYEWVASYLPIFKLHTLLYDVAYPIEFAPTGDPTVDAENKATIERNKKIRKIAERDDGYSFASPLNWWVQMDDLTDDEIETERVTGKPVPRRAQRFPTVNYGDGTSDPGAIVTLDRVRDLDDHYIYEKMKFKELAGNMVFDYIFNLSNGPAKVLSNILKLKSDKFVKDGQSAIFMSEIRNAWKYAVSFLPEVGAEINADKAGAIPGEDPDFVKKLRNATWNEVSLSTILAFCLTKLDPSSEELWNSNQFYEYLTELQKENVIDAEEREVLRIVAYDTQLFKIAWATMLHQFKKQVEKAAEFH